MAYVFKERNPPPGWPEFRSRAPRHVLKLFYVVGWLADWAAYFLGRWPVVELLEYLGSFSILFAAIFYFLGASDRLKQKHYQAWQVINTAQGKGGNGGRIDALEELNHDGVSLIAVNVAGAYLQGLKLERAQARRSNFSEADLRDADLLGAGFVDADLHNANFRGANLRRCNLTETLLNDSDLVGVDLSGADVGGAVLDDADLRNANLEGIKNWRAIKSLEKMNILGVRRAPEGFLDWARKKGAIEVKSE